MRLNIVLRIDILVILKNTMGRSVSNFNYHIYQHVRKLPFNIESYNPDSYSRSKRTL